MAWYFRQNFTRQIFYTSFTAACIRFFSISTDTSALECVGDLLPTPSHRPPPPRFQKHQNVDFLLSCQVTSGQVNPNALVSSLGCPWKSSSHFQHGNTASVHVVWTLETTIFQILGRKEKLTAMKKTLNRSSANKSRPLRNMSPFESLHRKP